MYQYNKRLFKEIEDAANAITNEEIAAIPTDTFFAIAADAYSPQASGNVQELKGRIGKPMPVFIASIDDLPSVASNTPPEVFALAENFWPGPLTLIIKKDIRISYEVTAGNHTVGIRVPDHPVTLEILRQVGKPITATSANLSGEPPCKTAAEVASIFPQLKTIVHSPCGAHIKPSTVLNLSAPPYKVLRVGAISVDAIRRILSNIQE